MAIGPGWQDGAWVDASWIATAWGAVVAVIAALKKRGFLVNVGRMMR